MSTRKRVEEIATNVAREIAKQIADIRMQQIQQQTTGNMGKISKVEGNQLTMELSNGDTRTVNNVGGRNVGIGDAVATDGKFIGI